MLRFRDDVFDFNRALDVIEGVTAEQLERRIHGGEYADFDSAEFAQRYARLAALMQLEEFDAVLLTQEENVRYFTGYLSVLWVSKFRPYLAILPANATEDAALLVSTQERG